jgi:cobalt-zinc-cadmium resistance protein CzcA
LNISESFLLESESLKIAPTALLDSTELKNHPYLQMLKQKQDITHQELEIERAKRLPNINLAYSNTTMRGNGADDVLYSNERFNSAQIGIGIPLFFGGQQAKVNSAKVMEKWAENQYNLQEQQWNDDFKNTVANYRKQLIIVNQFEQKSLKNADLIFEVANNQFQNGSINYLEWSMVINQAVLLKTNYLDAVEALNNHLIDLHYLISK